MAFSATKGSTWTAPWRKSTRSWIWDGENCTKSKKTRLGHSFIWSSYQKSFQNTYFRLMDPNFMQSSLAYLKGVGPHRAEVLRNELGVSSYRDLLQLFPNRYLDRTTFHKITQLRPQGAEVQIVGKIVHLKVVEQKRGKRLVATFVDDT